jgi:hypothetical protein
MQCARLNSRSSSTALLLRKPSLLQPVRARQPAANIRPRALAVAPEYGYVAASVAFSAALIQWQAIRVGFARRQYGGMQLGCTLQVFQLEQLYVASHVDLIVMAAVQGIRPRPTSQSAQHPFCQSVRNLSGKRLRFQLLMCFAATVIAATGLQCHTHRCTQKAKMSRRRHSTACSGRTRTHWKPCQHCWRWSACW